MASQIIITLKDGIAVNSDARRDFIRIAIKYGPAIILDALKQLVTRSK